MIRILSFLEVTVRLSAFLWAIKCSNEANSKILNKNKLTWAIIEIKGENWKTPRNSQELLGNFCFSTWSSLANVDIEDEKDEEPIDIGTKRCVVSGDKRREGNWPQKRVELLEAVDYSTHLQFILFKWSIKDTIPFHNWSTHNIIIVNI